MYICAIRVIRSLLPTSQTAFLGALCETLVPFVVSFWLWLRYAVVKLEYVHGTEDCQALWLFKRESSQTKLHSMTTRLARWAAECAAWPNSSACCGTAFLKMKSDQSSSKWSFCA